jgi:eukaryotic-like serine/threonine-protein kinase
VHIYHDSNLDRDVAIKVINPGEKAAVIRAEVASLPTIQSKHVVQVFDVIIDSDRLALVQEYVPGEDLTDFVATHPSESEYLKVLYQIASGIADIHAAGKIHRDIKPNNMKVDQEGIVKIFDFGLSCDESPAHVTTGGRGTTGFRAPELYGTGPVAVTPAVDTYAFGITAWALGDDDDLPQPLLELPPQSKTRAPSFSSHPINLPSDIVEVLDRTLAIDAGDRPDMSEVVEVLSRRLLFGQHKGRLILNGAAYSIAGVNKASRVNVPGKGMIVIRYDGLCFRITDLSGDVSVNGIPATLTQELPNSSVVIIGSPAQPASRTYMPFDISHPEVVL